MTSTPLICIQSLLNQTGSALAMHRVRSLRFKYPPVQTAQDGITGRSLADPQERMPSSPTTEYECQLEVITAGAIVAILVQLLTSQSMAITAATRALLSFCMVLELLGISLAICFVRAHHMRSNHPSQPPLALVQHALRVPTVLILTGIVGLGVALVVETLETSLGTAVTMSGFLIFGVIICVSLLVYGLGGLVWGKAGARRAGDHV